MNIEILKGARKELNNYVVNMAKDLLDTGVPADKLSEQVASVCKLELAAMAALDAAIEAEQGKQDYALELMEDEYERMLFNGPTH